MGFTLSPEEHARFADGKLATRNKAVETYKLQKMKKTKMNGTVTLTVNRLLLVVLFLMPMKLFSEEFQRFRIPGGSHLIRTDGVTLTATCLDGEARRAPHIGESFFAGSPAVSVTRIARGQQSTVSFNDAIKQKWIKVKGLESATSVQVTPVTPDPQTEYRLNVASGGKGVIGAGPEDVDGMLALLPSEPVPALDSLDKLTNALESVFDQHSIVTQLILHNKYELESKLHSQKRQVNTDDIVNATKTIKEMVFPHAASKEAVLTRCTILKHALLTEDNIAALQEAAPGRIGQYDPNLLAAAKTFLGRAEAFSQTLGPENPFADRYEEGLTRLRYNLIAETDSPVTTVNFKNPTKFVNDFVFSKEHWEALALYSGELLDDNALKAVKNFGSGQTEIYDPEFLAAWKDFSISQSLLSNSFGAESQLTQQFLERVRSEYRGNLSAALAKVRSGIFPANLQSLNAKAGNADYIALLFGEEINASKTDALKKALGWEVAPGPGGLESFIYVYKDDEDELVLNTTKASVHGSEASLKNLFQEHPNVVVEDGLVESDLAGVLRQNGVKFVRTFGHLVKSNFPSRPRVKLVFVISGEPSRVARMFPDQSETAVARALAIAKDAQNKGLGVVVDNKKSLIEALNSLEPDERAVICYHGNDHFVFWDSDLPIEYLSAHKYGDRCELLSCDTWRTSEWGMMSLDQIDLETTFNAAFKTAQERAMKLAADKGQTRNLNVGPQGAPPPPGGIPPGDFGGGFTANYADLESKDKKKMYLVVGIVVAGGVIAYYIVTSDRDTATDGG